MKLTKVTLLTVLFVVSSNLLAECDGPCSVEPKTDRAVELAAIQAAEDVALAVVKAADDAKCPCTKLHDQAKVEEDGTSAIVEESVN